MTGTEGSEEIEGDRTMAEQGLSMELQRLVFWRRREKMVGLRRSTEKVVSDDEAGGRLTGG